MRLRLRDILIAIPAIAAAVGIQYLVRKSYPMPADSELSMLLKPSSLMADSAYGTDYEGKVPDRYKNLGSFHRNFVTGKGGGAGLSPFSEERDLASVGDHSGGAFDAVKYDGPEDPDDMGNMVGGITGDGKKCVSIEYRGDGPIHTHLTPEEWSKVMAVFHNVKDSLQDWLENHRREFPDKTTAIMTAQLKKLKIERPPATEEPDLSWRGIGVLTQTSTRTPVIRMGGGLVKLILKHPPRGRFELTRLVAQVWAPCELLRNSAPGAWDPLLKCLGVAEDNACSAGTFSEGGWAVSSALAAIVSPPGCTVPAFADAGVAQCIQKVPLPLGADGA